MKKKFLYLFIISFLVSSCSTVGNLKTDDNPNKYPASSAAKIDVYSLDAPDRKYEVLGKVIASADAGTKSKIAVDMMKSQAAILGADAVIHMKLAIEYGYWATGITASGTAIKYIKN